MHLRKYKNLFREDDITLNKFKYLYILSINRVFSSAWKDVSQFVPFADCVNHENVDTAFDCFDAEGEPFERPLEPSEKEEAERLNKLGQEARESVMNMKRDMLGLEIQIRAKMREGGNETQTVQERQD